MVSAVSVPRRVQSSVGALPWAGDSGGAAPSLVGSPEGHRG